MTVTTEHRSWCGLCEAVCGLVAVVEDGRLASVRPDPEHPASQGFLCSKGMALPALLADPDRVTRPMRRRPDGEFEAVSWDEALDDIGRRLRDVVDRHGRTSIGIVQGNPALHNYAAFEAGLMLATALGTKNVFTTMSIDVNNYLVVSELLYGHNLITPIPDFIRTDFALVLGANPVVSHGSMATLGRVHDHLHDLVARGGRLVVVDPRRTRTAAIGEHVGIRPGGDPWFLAALLHVLFRDDLVDDGRLQPVARGVGFVRELVSEIDLDRAAAESTIPVARIDELAHALAGARSAVIYGRCGASLGRFSTLTKYLLDALSVVTGNLDRVGGMLFGDPYLDLEGLSGLLGLHGYDRWRTRVDGFPEVMGMTPVASLAREITTPGAGRVRALVAQATNIGATAPNPAALQDALTQLDLFVSLDPYITDTNHCADYVLPPTLPLERDGFPGFAQLQAIIPNAQWTGAVVEPPPQVRDDAWILGEIFRRIGVLPIPGPLPSLRLLARLPIRMPYALISDLAIRLGRHGDRLGLRRGGLRRRTLIADGRARRYAPHPPVGVLRRRVRTPDRRVHLDHPMFAGEMARLVGGDDEGDAFGRFPLRLFTIRELRGQNSWLHNLQTLMPADHALRLLVHPDDACERGLVSSGTARMASPWGAVEVPIEISDEVVRGSVGMPAHWGHRVGSWRRARRAGGAAYNRLVPNDAEHVDRLSGQGWLNGIPVRLTPVERGEP